jgi:hypothetical protein
VLRLDVDGSEELAADGDVLEQVADLEDGAGGGGRRLDGGRRAVLDDQFESLGAG